jgi:hypothetical protein
VYNHNDLNNTNCKLSSKEKIISLLSALTTNELSLFFASRQPLQSLQGTVSQKEPKEREMSIP